MIILAKMNKHLKILNAERSDNNQRQLVALVTTEIVSGGEPCVVAHVDQVQVGTRGTQGGVGQVVVGSGREWHVRLVLPS